jgi:hypothetical protein
MNHPLPERPPGDPILKLLVAWRTSPSEEATIALCDRLRGDAVKEAEVIYVARTVERLHARSVRVLLALGRLQLARGLLPQAQRTFVLAGRAECSSSPIANPALGALPTIPMAGDPQQKTSARKPSSLLLDVLCKLDDDEAIGAVARMAKGMPPRLPKRKAG